MKNLKKHPKQQRMEDMKIPGSNKRPKQTATQLVDSYDFTTPVWIESIKEDITVPLWEPGKCFYHPKEPAVLQSGTAEYNLCQKCLDKSLSKVTWEGREWLRSINDDNGFTLMPRIVWRLVAVSILAGAITYALLSLI